ncbi:alkaline phosphatase D family protein [Reyranella sp.]|uniref:alkaline phosphatase D family protein n=1 Tax=Reyranella sp. TaxID=1929291 RepID=UPI003BAC721C
MFRRRTLAQIMTAAALAPAPLVAQGPRGLSRIAFGSCADQDQPQPIWDAILAYRPELFIFAGDNVYGDFRAPDAANLRRAYARADEVAGYARLRAGVEHLAIWDDHDYGANDGGADFPHKALAKDLFLDFWKVPADDMRRRREGLYESWLRGPAGQRVQIIILDTRWFRSPLRPTDRRNAPGKERYLPDPDPAKTMLGATQWTWLAEALRQPAELRLLVSSIQVLAEGHGWERWGNFPLEREKLIATIRDSGARGVLLLSGDRHIGALYREAPPGMPPLYEVTSSGLNKSFAAAREPGPNRLGELYAAPNFGAIDIDWTGRSVTVALREESGAVCRSATVSFGELGLPA